MDAIHVKVRDRQVRNKPFNIVLGGIVNGERDILGHVGPRGRRGGA